MSKVDAKKVEQFLEKATGYLHVAEYEHAIKWLNRALEIQPDNAQAWFYKGVVETNRNGFEAAIACYEQSARTAGSHAFLPLFNMGNAFQSLGRIDEAIAAFYKAIKIEPDLADAWINLGRLLDDRGQHSEAIRCYDSALKSNSDDPVAWSNKGNSLRGLFKFNEALDCYKKSLQLDVRNLAATVGIASCYGQLGDPLTALTILNDVMGREIPPFVLLERAVLYGLSGRHEEAVLDLDSAIQQGLDSAEVWNNRGECLAKLQRLDESIASFDRALAIAPNFVPAWFGKARALVNVKRTTEARSAINKYFELAPGSDPLREAAVALRSIVYQS